MLEIEEVGAAQCSRLRGLCASASRVLCQIGNLC